MTQHSDNKISGEENEPPLLLWFCSWRGVYVFVIGCFVFYIVLLAVLSRAFS